VSHPGTTRANARTEDLDGAAIAPGQVLGGRYQIEALLGQGGMGEVWRAHDLKLRLTIALKAMLPGLADDERRVETLRDEVRTARAVVSPNVCRIFDLIEIDGRELVSMEYVDGQTLLAALEEHGPLELKQAQDIASQFLAGLEAIHAAGLVHRDVKPENIMLTRSGRVVLMDFGLARHGGTGEGSVAGTPAYMAPEQLRGEAIDARADVYAAGVVLAEMVSPAGVKSLDSRKSLWEGLRAEPPRLPKTPWAPVLKDAVATDRERRPNSAHTLVRALEDVTLRVEGADDLTPYPGLASFTEADAEYFFGREAEVEAMWARLGGAARLLGLVGPSGAGKTSFLRAGVMPAAPPDWSVLRCTPGTSAPASLRRVLVPALGGDTEALAELAAGDEEATVAACARWRSGHGRALLVVDQFEELFTLNPEPTRESFVELLHRLPLEADVHVLLSMRDDFLMECHRHEALRPMVSDLMLLDPPAGANLRRALVQPANRCGYRYENDDLVEEMLHAVEGERGALPLLAFAAAQLWERRDRVEGLLTGDAYATIGGVGGALARHAEATIDRIGAARVPVVRELLRNLVTAEGTRAVRDADELLSVFAEEDRGAAHEVLGELVDARLLTTYEVHEEDREPTRRVEIIHESLLANWPRLVRWQTQDADAAQLRDQLRQAARTWEEHGRSDDLLWTGTAYREFALWQESYPGGLSAVEQAFADAMARLAARRKRRRRMVLAGVLTVAAAVAGVTTSLWRRSELRALQLEVRRLCETARLEMDRCPPRALAFAMASLELLDNPDGRLLALEALWTAPMPTYLRTDSRTPSALTAAFSPDGLWLAIGHFGPERNLYLWSSSGGDPMILDAGVGVSFTRDSQALITTDPRMQVLSFWSIPDARRLLGQIDALPFRQDGTPAGDLEDPREVFNVMRLKRLVNDQSAPGGWDLDRRVVSLIGALPGLRYPPAALSTDGEHLVYALGNELLLASVAAPDVPPQRFGRCTSAVEHVAYQPGGERLAIIGVDGTIQLWSLGGPEPALVREWPGQGGRVTCHDLRVDPTGTVVVAIMDEGSAILRTEDDPPGADPLRLAPGTFRMISGAFDPNGDWLATAAFRGACLWPVARDRYPWVLRGHSGPVEQLQFSADGSWLGSISLDGTVRQWPLSHGTGSEPRILYDWGHPIQGALADLDISGDGRFVVTTGGERRIVLVPVDGSAPRPLGPFEERPWEVAIGPRSRLVAACGTGGIRVWDLETGQETETDKLTCKSRSFDLDTDGRLLVGGDALIAVDPTTGEWTRLVEGAGGHFVITRNRSLVLSTYGGATVYDRERGTLTRLAGHGESAGGLDEDGTIAVTSTDRTIFVGPATGGTPHWLIADTPVESLAVSPDGRFIASGHADGTIRLWPVPDASRPVLHELPSDELLAMLRSRLSVDFDLHDLDVFPVRAGPFLGWDELPEW
jgi:WD40 repeat protein